MMGKRGGRGRRREGWSWSKKTKGHRDSFEDREIESRVFSPRDATPFRVRCERKFFFLLFFFFFEDFFFFSPLFLFLFLFLFRNTLRFSVLDSALSNFSFFTPVFFGWNDFRTVKWRKRREREEGEEEEEEEGRMERGRKESNACLILLQHTSGPTFVFFPDNESRKYQGTRAFYWINRVSLLSNFVLWFWIVLRTILVTVLGISIDRMIWYQCLNHQ